MLIIYDNFLNALNGFNYQLLNAIETFTHLFDSIPSLKSENLNKKVELNFESK